MRKTVMRASLIGGLILLMSVQFVRGGWKLDQTVTGEDLEIGDIVGERIAWVDRESNEAFLFEGGEVVKLGNDYPFPIGPVSLPRIWGSKVVWSEDGNLMIYDQGETTVVSDDDIYFDEPDVFGDYVIMTGLYSDADGIYLYDGTELTWLTDGLPWDLENGGRIYGDRAAWKRSVGGDDEIVYYNGHEIVQLTDNDLSDFSLDISEDYVIWEQGESNSFHRAVMLYDGVSVQTLSEGFFEGFSRLSGNQVIWRGEAGLSSAAIFLFDGSEIHQLTNADGASDFPDVYQDKAVWVHKTNYDAQSGDSIDHIWLYDIPTGLAAIVGSGRNLFDPRLSDSLIVWGSQAKHNSVVRLDKLTILSNKPDRPDFAPKRLDITSGHTRYEGLDGFTLKAIIGANLANAMKSDYFDLSITVPGETEFPIFFFEAMLDPSAIIDGRYQFVDDDSLDGLSRLVIDFETGEFVAQAKETDLSGLTSPALVQLEMGDSEDGKIYFQAEAEINEKWINGKRPIPYCLRGDWIDDIYPIQVDKAVLRIDRDRAEPRDQLKLWGMSSVDMSVIESLDEIDLTIRVDPNEVFYFDSIAVSPDDIGKNGLKLRQKRKGLSALTFDVNRCAFDMTLSDVDLTGLQTPFTVSFGHDDEILTETVVEDRRIAGKGLPYILNQGYADAVRVERHQVKFHKQTQKEACGLIEHIQGNGSFSVSGSLALIDFDEMDLSIPGMVVNFQAWGKTYSLPAADFDYQIDMADEGNGAQISYDIHEQYIKRKGAKRFFQLRNYEVDEDVRLYRNPNDEVGYLKNIGPLVSATFDLEKATFKIAVRRERLLPDDDIAPGDPIPFHLWIEETVPETSLKAETQATFDYRGRAIAFDAYHYLGDCPDDNQAAAADVHPE